MKAAVMELPAALASAYKKLKISKTPLAVQIAGWSKFGTHKWDYIPKIITISNFNTKTLSINTFKGEVFNVRTRTFFDARRIASIGAPLDRIHWQSLCRHISNDQHRMRPIVVSINRIIKFMKFASRKNSFIGDSYIISVIPKRNLFYNNDTFISMGDLNESTSTFYHIDSTQKDVYSNININQKDQYAAHWVPGDGYGYADYKTGFDGDTRYVQMRIMATPVEGSGDMQHFPLAFKLP